MSPGASCNGGATAANPSLSYDWDTSKTTNGSHRINNEFIRKPIERDLLSEKSGKLVGLHKVKPSQVGEGKPISAKALHEAVATKNGFNNLSYGSGADVYTAKVNGRPVLITAAEDKYAGIDSRVAGELGLSRKLAITEPHLLAIEVGFGVAHEVRLPGKTSQDFGFGRGLVPLAGAV